MKIGKPRHIAAPFWLFLVIYVVGGCQAENPANDGSALDNRGVSGGAGGQVVVPAGGSFADQDWSAAGSSPSPNVVVQTDVDPEKCATVTAEAVRIEEQIEVEVPVEIREKLPVAIYTMLDQSASMIIPELSLQPRWWVAYDAINAFVNDPASADIHVALQYFPLQGAPCDGSVYDTPDVPMGVLPGHAAAIMNSLNTHLPFNDQTPIEPALIGATRFCQQFEINQEAIGERMNCAVVFITDGMPSQCNQDFNYISDIAGNAFNGDPSIYTFAIGMFGADFVLMNQIAQKGGTDCTPNADGTPNPADGFACDVSSGMTLLQALENIRKVIVRVETRIEYHTEVEIQALDCEWEIPVPPPGEIFDRNKVNVELSRLESPPETASMVKTVDACASAGNALAWYYDNPDQPTRIIACPNTCSQIQSGELGKISIVLGCKTKELIE